MVRFDFKFCQPKKLDHRDPFLETYLLERDFARHYAVTIDRKNPLLLPLFADFTDLPPFYVQVGSKEVLLDDSRKFAQRAKIQEVDATLDIWMGMWHARQLCLLSQKVNLPVLMQEDG